MAFSVPGKLTVLIIAKLTSTRLLLPTAHKNHLLLNHTAQSDSWQLDLV
jgi:hypothetical protein